MDSEFGMKRWALVLLAVIAAAAIGAMAYQAGVSHGVAMQPPVAAAPPSAGGAQAAPPPYVYYPHRFYGPRFGFFGPLLGILLFVFLLRTLFWGFWGWGWRGRRWYYADGPAPFDEWHRRAHERMHDGGAAAPSVPPNA